MVKVFLEFLVVVIQVKLESTKTKHQLYYQILEKQLKKITHKQQNLFHLIIQFLIEQKLIVLQILVIEALLELINMKGQEIPQIKTD